MWRAYVDYVDEMVVDGFFNTIHCSLKYLLENTESREAPNALFEAALELQVCKNTQQENAPKRGFCVLLLSTCIY